MWCFIYGKELKCGSVSELMSAEIVACNATFMAKLSHRFGDDKVFAENESHVVVLDGVTLNKRELIGKEQSWQDWCLKEEGYFCKKLRGLFSGVKYNKSNGSFYAFGCQIGYEPIFYYKHSDGIIVSPDFNIVWSIAKENQLPITFDELAANMMLSHGYLYRDNTFVSEIKKLQPGCMLVKDDKGADIEVKTYHRLKKEIVPNLTTEQAIEMVEESFTKAVRRCFDKDLEYGYSHLVDISGGLDSRTTNQVAIDLGYKNITNLCYAKSGSVEYDCASAYSKSVGNDFFFKQLDDLNFFYDIDLSIEQLYGLTYYFACTGGMRFMRAVNTERFGLEHSGQLGDAVLGEFHRTNGHFSFTATSTVAKIIAPQAPDLNEENEEEEIHYPYYMRMFAFTLKSQLVKRYYDWWVVSPFADIDFMHTCLSIPVEMREGHKLYFDWLYAKHPNTTKVRCTTVDGRTQKTPMTFRHMVGKILGKRRNDFIALVKRLSGKDLELRPTNTMNPFDHWYETVPKLRDFMSDYFNGHISMLAKFPDTQKDVQKLFEQGSCLDKGCALTVLAAYKRYLS